MSAKPSDVLSVLSPLDSNDSHQGDRSQIRQGGQSKHRDLTQHAQPLYEFGRYPWVESPGQVIDLIVH